MRVESWNPEMYDEIFENKIIEDLVNAAIIVKDEARKLCPEGTVTRPIYKRGPYAGQPWTRRDAGALKKTIRVRRKHTKRGKPFKRGRGGRTVRVYAGNFLRYYASIVEHSGQPFLRPALLNAIPRIKEIIGAE
jgi:hypothetical protein